MGDQISPRNRAERRSAGKKARAAGAVLTAGSAALAMGAAWIGTGIESAHAAGIFTVTANTDNGTGQAGTLSEAIGLANASPGSTINFNVPSGSIAITGAMPQVTAAVAITGPGASALTIDGGSAHQIFHLNGNANVVTISGITLTHASGQCGGIQNSGEVLTISDSVLSDNAGGYGAAICSGDGGHSTAGAGSLAIVNSSVTGNDSGTQNAGALGFYGNQGAYNTLTITNSVFDHNHGYYGAGFYAAGTIGDITVTGSTFSNNDAIEGGGGFMVDDISTSSAVTVLGSTISGNTAPYGAGVLLDDADGGTLIDSTAFDNNTATAGSGGGLYAGTNENGFEITNSTFTGNRASDAGGGFMAWYNDTVISVTGTTFSGNQAGSIGGGMLFDDNRDGDRFAVNVTSSTFSGNTAATGGGGLGFYNGAGVTITDTTISGNQATVAGGVFAAFVNGPTAINNSTITGNTANAGGGVLFGGYYGLSLNQDTIVANTASTIGGVFLADAQNTALGAAHTARVRSSSKKDKAYGAHDRDGAEATGHAKTARVHAAAAQLNALTLSGTILTQNTNGDLGNSGTASSTHSILGVVDPGTVLTDVGGTLMGVDPMLGPLASNGGPTQTMELLVGSPAINAGPDPVAAFAGNEFDQRGAGFPRVTGGTVDIGAFEVQPVQIAPRFTG